MKLEKINDNQIRCTLTKEDLANRQIKLSELAYGTEKTKSLFRDMMQQAAKEFGFIANDIPLMIEAIPISSESIILIITKVEDPEELDTRFAKFAHSDEDDDNKSISPIPSKLEGADDILDIFSKLRTARKKTTDKKNDPIEEISEADDSAIDLTRLYTFENLDTVIEASQILAPIYYGCNSLYKDANKKEYLLIISKSKHTPEEFNKVCNILSEYASNKKYAASMQAYYQEHLDCLVADTAIQNLACLK